MPEQKPRVAHYAQARIQPIDYMEATFTREEFVGYLKGNALKYLSRFQFKGTPEADLIKAATYLGWLLEAVKKEKA